MKCNHLALAIGGCFSKRRTAALLKSVSQVGTARAPEQRQSSARLPGMGAGQEAPTSPPVCPLGVPGRSQAGLSAVCLLLFSPSVLGQHGKVAAPNCCSPDRERRWDQPSSSSSNPTHSHPAPQNEGVCACVYPDPSWWLNPLT